MSIDLLTAAKVHGLTIRKDGDRIFLNDIEAYPEGTSYVPHGEGGGGIRVAAALPAAGAAVAVGGKEGHGKDGRWNSSRG